jgi:hypothetical protein
MRSAPAPLVGLAAALILGGLMFMAVSPVIAGGQQTGEVTFRLTLEGPVPDDEGFYIDVRCDGGEFCEGADEPRYVYFCATPDVADAAICIGDTNTFQFTAGIPTQRITYDLYRETEISRTDEQRSAVVLSGSWEVRAGEQVISLGYVYPGGTNGPGVLPDTAMPAP